MYERIRQINVTISTTKRIISDVDERLFTSFPADVYTEVKSFCTHTRNSTWKTLIYLSIGTCVLQVRVNVFKIKFYFEQ